MKFLLLLDDCVGFNKELFGFKMTMALQLFC